MNVLWLTASIFCLDQISKYAIKHFMDLYESIPVISDFFYLTFVLNPGIAFGLNIPGGFVIFKILHLLMNKHVLSWLNLPHFCQQLVSLQTDRKSVV